MHKILEEKNQNLAATCHKWLAPLACSIIMISPIIRFSTNLGLIADALGLILLIISAFLLGSKRKIQYLDRLALMIITYFIVLVAFSAILIGTDMAFEKTIAIILSGVVFFVTIFAFNESPDLRVFSITFISLSFIFTAISFQKGLAAIYEIRLLFSFSCAISIFSIYFLLEGTKWYEKIFLLMLLMPFIYWGTLSGNRSLLLITLLIISFHYLFYNRKPFKAALIFIPLSGTLGSLYWYFFSETKMITRVLATLEAGTGREAIWSSSLSGIIETFPIGAGVNESYHYLPGFFWSHNIFLELLLEFGVFSIPIILVVGSITLIAIFSKKKEQVFFLMLFLICLLNFMKSFSLGDIRLLILPLALLIIAMRKRPKLRKN